MKTIEIQLENRKEGIKLDKHIQDKDKGEANGESSS